jgi:hypothetical protein
MCTGIAKRQGVSSQDPLLDFAPETTAMYGEPLPASASFPMMSPPTHAIDTTSRVISFVLGFALASLIAWLGSISGDSITATGDSEDVAAVGTPMVATAIEEKKPVTTPQTKTPASPPPRAAAAAPAPGRASVAAPIAAPAAPRLAAASPPAVRPAAIDPSRTVEPVSSDARAARPTGFRGGLSLTSNPAGAQVMLNGKVVGQTPVVLKDLPVGSRGLVVRRDGYSPWSTSVRIVADQLTTVRANLVPARQSGG